jgi:methylthioribulose-1-phosphate dehydratase
MVAYKQKKAGAVIHTHSPAAVMATLLWPGREFRITHQGLYFSFLFNNLSFG